MFRSTLESRSVQRLQGILKHRYGKGLEVRQLVDASSMDLSKAGAAMKGEDLIIPIELHGVFLGLAKVPQVTDLPQSSLDAITEVVRLILEPNLYSQYLSNQSHSMHRLDIQEDEIRVVSQDLSIAKSSGAVLLVSDDPAASARAARILHEGSDRWAFLSFLDMNRSLGTVDELKALGRATIFIEDLLFLSPTDQQTLTEFLQTSVLDEHPLVIIGSTREFGFIQEAHQCTPALLDLIAPYVADLKRWPSDEKSLKHALEMLIEPLALPGV